MKKLLILLLMVIMVTGCNNYTELNDLAIIKSIGIDYSNNEYILYAEIIEEIKKDNIPQTKVLTTNSKDIKTLFKNIKLLVNKEIYLSHIDLLILSTNLKNNNYEEIITYFLNNKDIRNDFLTIFSNEILLLLENSKYDEIEQIITTNKDSKKIYKTNFEDIIKNFYDTKSFKGSYFTYDEEIKYVNNIIFKDNKTERINNEKEN